MEIKASTDVINQATKVNHLFKEMNRLEQEYADLGELLDITKRQFKFEDTLYKRMLGSMPPMAIEIK